nr:integrase, catalytic region, zinc finger, CCHC-type, peptidase aspartic, catalytic [Tanacetum cinerariifolium]
NKSSHQPKAEDTNQEKLYLLHMDLCGPMRVESINEKKYILVIVDDYSRFTLVRFLRSKDEAPDAIIKCIKNIQVCLNATVRNVRTDNGTEFVNQTLRDFYENPNLSFLHVFGSLCYPTNDNEDLGKLNAKADIGIFVGYAPAKKAFRIYNRKTQKIMETIHVTFDELTTMASKQFGSGPRLQSLTSATTSPGLVPNPIPQQPCNPPNRDDWDRFFQPIFDEYFNPPTIDVSPIPVAAAPRAVDTTESPVSTSINLDAPSASIPSTQEHKHSPIISQDPTLFMQSAYVPGIRCISGKTTRLDRLRESRAQILWGVYNKKNVNYVALLWEDFMYQADNGEISLARKEHMPYPRFTKVIINHFISKDKTISMRNRINLHVIRDDSLLDIKDSKAYKNYYDFAARKATPKKERMYNKVASPSRKLSHVLEEEPAEKSNESVPKKKTPNKVDRGKGMDLLSDVALLEATQLKKSKMETHKLHATGSGDGFGSLPKVLDEQEDKTTGTDEGISTKLGILDVPKYLSESENKSEGDSDDDDNDDNSDEVTKDDDEGDVESDADHDKEASDSEKTDSDEDEKLNFNQNDDEEKEHKEEYVRTPDSFKFNDDDDDEEYEELYKDVNVSTQQTKYKQVKDDEHVKLTTVHDTQKSEGPMQSSFVSFDFAKQFLNLANVPPTETKVVSMLNVKVSHEEPSTQTPPLLNIPVTSQIPAIMDAQLSTRLEDSIKKSYRSYTAEFEKKAKDDRKIYIDLVEKSVIDIIKDEVKSQLPQILPHEVSNYATPVIQRSMTESLENIILAKSSSQPKSTYKAVASLTEFELKKILLNKIQKNKDKDEDPTVGSDKGLKKHKTRNDVEPSRGSKSKESKSSSSKGSRPQTKSFGKSAQAEEPVFETVDIQMPLNQGEDLDSDWNTTKTIDFRPPQTWISKIAKAGKPPTTFDELMSTPIDFLAYVLNNLKIENLIQEYLVGPAFNLLNGT